MLSLMLFLDCSPAHWKYEKLLVRATASPMVKTAVHFRSATCAHDMYVCTTYIHVALATVAYCTAGFPAHLGFQVVR